MPVERGTPPPRLLVSIRTVDEARQAIAAGADLIDCKEPRNGPLGRPSAQLIRDVITLRDARATTLHVSAALGELVDLDSGAEAVADSPCARLDFVKLGLQGMGSVARWRDRWLDARNSLTSPLDPPPAHVAVAYADWRIADAPLPQDVVSAAIESQCAGVLFDTYSKSSRGLLTHLSVAMLRPMLDQIRIAGLFTALAGQLRLDDLPALHKLPFDILAVRSAVCESADRRGQLSPGHIRRLRDEMQRVWSRSK